MKIWLKILIAVIIGILVGKFMPQFDLSAINNIFKYSSAFKFLSDLTINLLLFTVKLYILVKIFLSVIKLQKSKLTGKSFSLFLLFTFISLMVSIIIATLLMNLEVFHPRIDFTQVKHKVLEYTTFDNLILNTINENMFATLAAPTKFLLPVIFIAFIFGLGAFYAGRKSDYFIETIESFEKILDKVILQFLELFSIGVIFIIVSLMRDDVFNFKKISFMLPPLFAVILTCFIVVAIYTIILAIVLKKQTGEFYLGFAGALLTALITGNSAACIIPVTEHLNKNVGVKSGTANTLGPIGLVINKSGTVIISTVILLSLILIYTPDILSIQLQLSFFLLILLYSFFLDGSNTNGFLIIVAMILNFQSLHLEQDSYLLFIASLPLFSRIAALIDSLSTGVFITLISKITGNIEERKYIDYI